MLNYGEILGVLALRKFILPLILFLFSCAYTLTVPESELNKRLQETFPIEKEMYLSRVILDNPKLKLIGKNEGEIIFDLDIIPPIGKEIRGKVDAVGSFTFDRKTKTLYLVNLETKSVTINGKTFLTKDTGELLSLIFKTVLNRVPVYRFEGGKAKLIKDIRIEKGKVVVKLGV